MGMEEGFAVISPDFGESEPEEENEADGGGGRSICEKCGLIIIIIKFINN